MKVEGIGDLALQLRTELRDESPRGFHSNDQAFRQDAGLSRLVERLGDHGDPDAVAAALALALEEERDGWTVLKLLEVVDRLGVQDDDPNLWPGRLATATAPALIRIARRNPEDNRGKFLAGRACEILLKLPLDLEARAMANEACKNPLENIRRFRIGDARARALHRPRRIEWMILIGLMLLALGGFFIAWSTLHL